MQAFASNNWDKGTVLLSHIFGWKMGQENRPNGIELTIMSRITDR